jgi:hypothetical protein
MPEARPGLVHRRLPAAADPQHLAVLIRHRPGIAGDAGIGARRVELRGSTTAALTRSCHVIPDTSSPNTLFSDLLPLSGWKGDWK